MPLADNIAEINSGLEEKAQTILEEGLSFLNNLEEIASNPGNAWVNPKSINTDFNPDISIPDPNQGEIDSITNQIQDAISKLDNITLPQEPSLKEVDTNISIEPTQAPKADNIQEPREPNVNLNFSIPNEPQLQDISIPQEPNITIPDMPNIEDISLPDIPTLEPISIDIDLPEFVADIPSNVFQYSEKPYQSDLKDKLTQTISDNLDGGTLLPEQEMFDRAKERNQQVLNETINKAIDVWASRGFDLPNGMLEAEIDKILLDYQHSRLDLSRDIAIEQAKIRRENINNAIQEGTKLEQIEMQYATESLNRLLTSSKYFAEFAVQLYNLKVAHYNTMMDRAKTLLAIYSEKLKANLQRIEQYKSLLEGSRIKADIQNQRLRAYAYQIEAIKSHISLYQSKLDAVKTIAEVNVSKMQQYRALLDSYVAKLNAESKKIDVYLGKISAYKAKIDAYTSKVRAVESENRAKEAMANIAVKKGELAIQANKAKLDGYKYAAEVANIKANTIAESVRSLGISADAYAKLEKSKTDVAEAKGRLAIGFQEISLEAARQETLSALEAAKASVQAFVELQRIREKAAEGGSQIYAAMANAALSAINSAVSIAAKEISYVSSDTSANY